MFAADRSLDTAHYLEIKHSLGARLVPPAAVSARDYSAERLGTESSVDDLGTCRAVVLSRAATILRSIETQASTGRFVLVREQLSAAGAFRLFFSMSRARHSGTVEGKSSTPRNGSLPLTSIIISIGLDLEEISSKSYPVACTLGMGTD